MVVLSALLLGVALCSAGCTDDGGGAPGDGGGPGDVAGADVPIPPLDGESPGDVPATPEDAPTPPDDVPAPPEDAPTPPDDTAGDPCTDEACAALGQACNRVTGQCVADARCLAAGQPCDPADQHPRAFSCQDDGAGSLVCLPTCVDAAGCADGETCYADPDAGGRATCRTPECEPFGELACDAGETCTVPLVLLTEDDALGGLCAATGAAAVGEPCVAASDCASGFCQGPPEGATCQAACDARATEGDGTCGAAAVCDALRDESGAAALGACVPFDCEPFGDQGCDAGEMCALVADLRNADGETIGRCQPAGTREVGETCTGWALGECAPGLGCLPDDEETWSCYRVCDPLATDGAGHCGAGALCAPLLLADGTRTTAAGFCVENACAAFGALGCADGEMCEVLAALRDAAGETIGTCKPAGTVGLGETCTGWASGECAPGLLCLQDEAETWACYQACDPEDAEGPGACGASQACSPITTLEGQISSAVGFCVAAECEPFGDLACPEGEMCELTSLTTNAQGELVGECLPIGSAGVGDACGGWGLGDCAPGLTCLADGAGGNWCFGRCDPQAAAGEAGACAAGQRCRAIGLTDGTTSEVFGFCQTVCTPFVAESGCAEGEHCIPDFEDASFGYCEATGARAEGATCNAGGQCGPGLICIGYCAPTCDFSGAAGAGGACADGMPCVQLSLTGGGTISFGYCAEGCTAADPADGCADGGVCLSRAIAAAQATGDFCIPGNNLAASCTLETARRLCDDGLAQCLDLPGITDGLACVELCRASEGDFLRVGHPDCSDPDAICDPSRDRTHGVCNAPR
jgi:hypothetical protein